MAWTDLTNETSGGNGWVNYRLEFAGYDKSFVTDIEMCNNTQAVKRIPGLTCKGLKIAESLKLPQMILELGGNQFQIVDYQDKATEAFRRKPTHTTTLVQNVLPTSNTFRVANVGSIKSGDYLWIGQETVRVFGAIAGDPTALIVSRGQLGSVATSHFVTTDMGTPLEARIWNSPFTLERKRCKLYGYSNGDDLQGTGTLLWRGVVMSQPSSNGPIYTIQCGPITETLKSDIGIDGDDIKLRGLNFPQPWTIRCDLKNSATINGGTVLATVNLTVNGFFESVYDLVAYMNSELERLTNNSTWNTTVKIGVLYNNDGELFLTQRVVSSGAVAKSVQFTTLFSPAQTVTTTEAPLLQSYFTVEDSNIVYRLATNDSIGINNSPMEDYKTLLAKDVVYASRFQSKVFPHQFALYRKTADDNFFNSFSSTSKRFYLDTQAILTTINAIVVSKDDVIVASSFVDTEGNNFKIDLTERYFTCQLFFPNQDQYSDLAIINNDYKISIATTFGAEFGVNDPGANIVSFIRFLLSVSRFNVNNGTIPLLSADDFDLADMETQYKSISPKSLQNRRAYIFYKKIKKFEEFLSEELKLVGLFPALTSTGKYTLRQLRTISPYEEVDHDLDSDDILTDDKYPTSIANEFGIWNAIKLHTNYNALEEKHQGQPYIVQNMNSIAEYGQNRVIDIKPYSITQMSGGDEVIDLSDLYDIYLRLTSMFSEDFEVVTLEVPMKFFYVGLGSTIRFKNKQLPNWHPDYDYVTSRRGSSRYVGTIVGKSFDLENGNGSIKILISNKEWLVDDKQVKGIFNCDGMTQQIHKINDLYLVVPDPVTTSMGLQPNTYISDVWSVNDGIKFSQFDTMTNNEGVGTIIGMSGSQNNVSFFVSMSTVPTGFTGSAKFYFQTPEFNSLYITEDQKLGGFYDGAFVATQSYYSSPTASLVYNYADNVIGRVMSF